MHKNISPHIYVFSTLLTALLAFFIFSGAFGVGDYRGLFLVPVLGLAVIYGIVNLVRQSRGLSRFRVQKDIRFASLLKKSVARYLVWLVVISLARSFYEVHPTYRGLRDNSLFFSYLFRFYLIGGLPYFLITLKVKSSAVEDFYDPSVRIIHILKQTATRLMRGDFSNAFRALENRYNRKVLLNLVIRFYFIPVMVSQIYSNVNNAVYSSNRRFMDFSYLSICSWILSMLWLMDALNTSLSYCVESRWIENRSRSVDTTVGGWLVCVACYAPINGATGALFPFGPLAGAAHPGSILSGSMTFLYAFRTLEALLLGLHIYAVTSLGPSMANLTFKKLQTRGLYGVIRHPGTTFKLIMWWMQSAAYAEFWRVEYIFGQLMWNVLYVLRAFTEERHLSNYREYRDYKDKVRYRFIPGVL